MMLLSPLHPCKSRGSASVGLTPGYSRQSAHSLRLVCVISHQHLQPPWTPQSLSVICSLLRISNKRSDPAYPCHQSTKALPIAAYWTSHIYELL